MELYKFASEDARQKFELSSWEIDNALAQLLKGKTFSFTETKPNGTVIGIKVEGEHYNSKRLQKEYPGLMIDDYAEALFTDDEIGTLIVKVPAPAEKFCVMTADGNSGFLIRAHDMTLARAEEVAELYVRENEDSQAMVIKKISSFTAKKEIVVDKVQY
ncbi:hypothetical protein pzkkv8_43 [Klebsiella phage pzk-kv8]|nr:hypothetical protein pzkkv8_43 [Klebsiella phage pzk-kv8]